MRGLGCGREDARGSLSLRCQRDPERVGGRAGGGRVAAGARPRIRVAAGRPHQRRSAGSAGCARARVGAGRGARVAAGVGRLSAAARRRGGSAGLGQED